MTTPMTTPIIKRNRIIWTDDEKKVLINKITELYKDDPFISFTKAYSKASELLPKNRRRSAVNTTPIFSELSKYIKHSLKEDNIKIIEKEVEKIVQVEKIIPQKLEEISTDKLIQELSRRLLQPLINDVQIKISNEIRTFIASQMIKQTTQITENTENTEQIKKPKILIIGLLPDQQNHISKEYESLFELKFIKDNYEKIKDISNNCDYVIIMTKFISHSQEYALKTITKSYIRCDGGLSTIKTLLDKIFYDN